MINNSVVLFFNVGMIGMAGMAEIPVCVFFAGISADILSATVDFVSCKITDFKFS